MMRAAGLAMVLLGLLGLAASLVDWRITGPSQGDDAGRRNAAAERGADAQESPQAATRASVERAPSPAPSSAPTATNGVTESNPANVRVFEPDSQPAEAEKKLWADISAGSDVVDEDSGHASFLVTLSEPAERSVVIIFSTVDLSATDEEDYRSQRGTVTFEPGVVSAEIRTPLVDDEIKEEDEQFAIVLNGAPGIVNFRSRRITATIRDDD